MMAVLLLQGDAKSGNKIHKPPKASSNQDNITLLPFAVHLSCLESLPANAISAAMLGDLPVYSHNQACCLCTPRSFCPRSGMSPRDQTVTAPAPGVLETFILHSHIIAYESTTEQEFLSSHTVSWVMNVSFLLPSVRQSSATSSATGKTLISCFSVNKIKLLNLQFDVFHNDTEIHNP